MQRSLNRCTVDGLKLVIPRVSEEVSEWQKELGLRIGGRSIGAISSVYSLVHIQTMMRVGAAGNRAPDLMTLSQFCIPA